MKNEVNILVKHLGAAKQIPYLVREIKKELPKLKINIFYDEDGNSNFPTKETIISDLKFEGINSENIELNKFEECSKSYIKLDFTKSYLFSKGAFLQQINLFLDPLKFEKRRLLTKEEQKKLKKDYKVLPGKVILGGSLGKDENKLLIDSTKELIKNSPSTQVILTPRNYNENIKSEINSTEIDFKLDNEESYKNYIVVTKKGILDKLYSICDTAVIGDSFERGNCGQNPLEPAFYGKRIISGENYKLNEKAYCGLEISGLLKRVSKENLSKELLRETPKDELKKYQECAKNFIESKRGAAKIYAKIIKEGLEGKLNENRFEEMISKVP
ncbi:MAG: hypothetical protein NUV46_02745 [Nanoarchaeota archaeon]|nr:hypothetical protein [Nanoarchaeota archaeon]